MNRIFQIIHNRNAFLYDGETLILLKDDDMLILSQNEVELSMIETKHANAAKEFRKVVDRHLNDEDEKGEPV